MNRIIKLRAWIPELKSMMMAGTFDFWLEAAISSGINACRARPNQVIMQFTGLLDKNGKELYEGDLCKDGEGDIIEIGMETAYVDYIKQPLELIGNIYESNKR